MLRFSRVGRAATAYAIVYTCMIPETTGYKMFQRKLPNGANVPGFDAIGHVQVGGGPINDFGLDFKEAEFMWTTTFCEKDSDGDGQTNGQELGDPCCEFVQRKNEKVRWTEGVSHPGDLKLKADPALWEGIVCGVEANAEVVAKEEDTEVAAKVEPTEVAAKEETTEVAAMEEITEVASVEDTQNTVVDVAVQSKKETLQEKPMTSELPTMYTSVMLSAALLMVMVIYMVVMWMKRRSSYNLPIFRQQRRQSRNVLSSENDISGDVAIFALSQFSQRRSVGRDGSAPPDPVLDGLTNELGWDMIDADSFGS
ncbi:unnamed protein product [Peronospora farinosa]|uniref:Temptin Cys/Cys disulfide domain-containing protein n=1 Tax=Peronospora farinosa TaxID=134698 RepID=A0AAV0TNR2_9STRA|nr:unnamed protein product [Peronospora farinosa]CAI5724602.1 unnamed protein product [Peronospora farinosa]